MLDSCEGMKSASEYHFEKEMNCLPKQLMVLFYGVSSQQWFFGLSLELPYALKIDTSRQQRQPEFSLIFSMKAQPIPFLKLGTMAGNLQDAPSYPSSKDQIQHPKKVDQDGWWRNSSSIFLEKKQQITSPSEANSPSRAIHKGWIDPQKRWERHSCHQESKRVEERLTLIQSCKQREARSDPS